jgi:hypothetical protein
VRSPVKPWYRASKDAWYVEFNGKQIRLANGRDNEKATFKAFCKLMANGSGKLPEADTLRVATVCDLFLDYSQKHHVHDSYRFYKDYLQDFCELYGTLLVAGLLILPSGFSDESRRSQRPPTPNPLRLCQGKS